MSFNKDDILLQICPPLDSLLVSILIDEFISQEQRYVLGDWEPATLDGGQFAEVASRIIYHIDSSNLNRRKGVDSCLRYIEDKNNSNSHSFPQRRTSLHLCKVIRTIYKFRSQRGAIHIDPDYTANELDSTLVISNVRWVIAELFRVFWSGDRRKVSSVIKELLRYDVPSVFSMDDRKLVVRTDCTVEEEILILLCNEGGKGMSRRELGKSIPRAASLVTKALKNLMSHDKREVVRRSDGYFILSPMGSRRIREELSEKLAFGS